MADSGNKQAKQGKGHDPNAKVLRIGIVQGGKVVHERLIRPGQSVSMGESPKNTFVVTINSLPKRYTLFQAKGDNYFLNFTEQMRGKISHNDTIQGLDELVKSGEATKKGSVHALNVGGQTRGKIVVDDVTVLFQFVPPPPVSIKNLGRNDFRPQLLDEDDPLFLGFLALFSAMAAVLMIYVHSVEPVDMIPLDDLPDRFVNIVLPDEAPTEEPEIELVEDGEPQMVEKQEVAEPTERAPKREMSEEQRAAAEAARQQRMAEDVMKKSLLLSMIGTRGDANSGDMIEDVFADQDSVGSSLEDALKNVSGVEVASSENMGVKKGGGGGREDAGIGDLAKGGGGNAAVGSGPSKSVNASSKMGAIDAGYGEGVDAVKGTINKYKPQIKYCYEQQIKTNPGLAGRLAIEMDIVGGKVTGATVAENGTGSTALKECVLRKVRSWRFPREVDVEGVYLPFILSAD